MTRDFLERIANSDEEKASEVSLYLFELYINGQRYGGEMPALSWEQAHEAVQRFGGRVIGRSIESILVGTICSVCGDEVRISTEIPEPLDEEFPEEIDD